MGFLSALAGPIVGGLFGMKGQESANAANAKLARENREWQERMSNTAYRRSAHDLEQAGLNRILALGGPASTPAGNVATMQNTKAPLQQGISDGISKALTAKMMAAQIETEHARARLTNRQADAIAPAANVGEGVDKLLDVGRQRLKNMDWESMLDRARQDVSGAKQTAQNVYSDVKQRAKDSYVGTQGKLLVAGASNAREHIARVAKSVNLERFKAPEALIHTVRQMDLPKMTDDEALKWALENPEKIKAFLERQRNR